MGVSMDYMRDYVIKSYPSDNWKLRVQNMQPSQVAAIYHSLINRKRKSAVKKLSLKPLKAEYEQITLYDLFGEVMNR